MEVHNAMHTNCLAHAYYVHEIFLHCNNILNYVSSENKSIPNSFINPPDFLQNCIGGSGLFVVVSICVELIYISYGE